MQLQTHCFCVLIARESHLQGTEDAAGKGWRMFSPAKQIPHAPPCTSALSIWSYSCSGIHAGFSVLFIPLGLLLVLKWLLKKNQDLLLQHRQTEWLKFIIRLKELSSKSLLLGQEIYWGEIIQMGVWLQVMRLFHAVIMLLKIKKCSTNITKKTYNGRKEEKSHPLGCCK